jgi:pentatricopeptide repeat protein
MKLSKVDSAMQLFQDMIENGPKPDKYTISIVLTGIADTATGHYGEQVYRCVLANRMNNTMIVTSLINMYGKCAQVDDARKVFDAEETDGIGVHR